MRIFCLILVKCSFAGSASADISQMALSCRDDCTYFYIKSSSLMDAAMPDLFLVQLQLSNVDLPCSPRAMMLVLKRGQEIKERVRILIFLKILLIC